MNKISKTCWIEAEDRELGHIIYKTWEVEAVRKSLKRKSGIKSQLQ